MKVTKRWEQAPKGQKKSPRRVAGLQTGFEDQKEGVELAPGTTP